MSITAEQFEDLFNHGGTLELADGSELTRDELVQYIDNNEIDTDDDGAPLDDQWQVLADVLGGPTPGNASELVEIITAANDIKTAEQRRDSAIRTAITAGHSVISIAGAADLSRARIYQIRDGRR